MRHTAEGRPLPGQASPVDMPDDYFRVRLVCVLLDTCGMCFDRGTQSKKLDNFLAFFQVCGKHLWTDPKLISCRQLYVLTKAPPPMDVEFMLSDSLEVRDGLLRYDFVSFNGFHAGRETKAAYLQIV